MQKVYIVIRDCGDGSQTLEWHLTMNDAKIEKLENDEYESYASGEGVQIKKLQFPDCIDLNAFAKVNHIYWFDDATLDKDDVEL